MNQRIARTNRRKVGTGGENYASMILARDGYSVLCRNYTCPKGEVDIIAAKDDCICFVEVKLRSLSSGVSAAEAVDKQKLARISGCIIFSACTNLTPVGSCYSLIHNTS